MIGEPSMDMSITPPQLRSRRIRPITGITAVSNDGSQAQFHARGAALESQQDGIPSEMALSGNQQYDLAIYDRIEVLRGPAGVLQGAGAFAGTVNLVRKRPKPIFSTAAWASTGEWNNSSTANPATDTGGIDISSVGNQTLYPLVTGWTTGGGLGAAALDFHGG